MADLRRVLADAGYDGVQTHLQSGNVLLESDLSPQALERQLETVIGSAFGIPVPVLVRTRRELAEVVARDPLRGVADDGSRYLVTFLATRLAPAVARELEAADVAPERVVVGAREVYAWVPDGVQRSRAARFLSDARLGVVTTARNWNTVTRLLELTGR